MYYKLSSRKDIYNRKYKVNLFVKQIFRQKNIPYDIEEEIYKYLPDFDQENKLKLKLEV